MSYRPTRIQAIRMIEDLVKILKNDGAEAQRLAKDLASATGLPARTLGDGGSRGTGGDDSTSSAALRILEHGADRYEDADVKLDELMAKVAVTSEVLRLYLLDLLAHAVAEEEHEGTGLVRPTRAGGGECIGCGRPVPGTEKDRLRGGACSACAMAWIRHAAGNPHADRVVFMRNRRPHDSAAEHEGVDLTAVVPKGSGSSALAIDVARASAGSAVAISSTHWRSRSEHECADKSAGQS